ncbi:MAG: DUF362 domain-containing protein [Candidatus Aminicenantes bacterium]|nr:DUF362 domain-containing protein [Candidatus Aminicenantes bacterium]
MKMAKVSIVKVADYNSEEIYTALKRNLSLLGGLEDIIKPRSKVFVKINHLSPPSSPDDAIVTHPYFTKEVLRLLLELNLEITVGDDVQSKEKDGFLLSGYRKVCNDLGVRLINLKQRGFREVICNGQIIKKVLISPLLHEADYILNLPKLKTHALTVFTGAVKNMFGIIPYGLRLDYHRLYKQSDVFSQMLVDIFSCAPPHLTIMDAIVAMEGEGPSGGSPKRVGVILASQDSVAVDAVASKIVGFNPMNIFTTQNAHERGVGKGEIEKIEISGEDISGVEVRNFKHSAVAIGFIKRKIPSFLHGFIQGQLTLTPKIILNKCALCMECVDICPKGAAKLARDLVWIDSSLCICCMCCHEVCRFQAIKLRQRPLGRIFREVSEFFRKAKSLFR